MITQAEIFRRAEEIEKCIERAPLGSYLTLKDAMLAECVYLITQLNMPVDMLLFCPRCASQHVDAPEAESLGEVGADIWTNPPHRTHQCKACQYRWRPSDRTTNGTASIKTRGKSDMSAVPHALAVLQSQHDLLIDFAKTSERLTAQNGMMLAELKRLTPKKVVAGIIRDEESDVLIARRHVTQKEAGMWCFPGGKLEDGELEEDALIREINEELGVHIVVESHYGHRVAMYEHGVYSISYFNCKLLSGQTPKAIEVAEFAIVEESALNCYVDMQCDRDIARVLSLQAKLRELNPPLSAATS